MIEDPAKKTALKRKRRRLERLLLGAAVLVIIGLTVLQTQVVRLGAGVPMTQSILIFVLINVNIVLLFMLLFLVLRNLYKIFFEQKQVLGSQLRTKLVVAFVSLTLVPTMLLFYAGLQFISTGHDYWFDENVERSLVDSLALAQFIFDVNERMTHDFGQTIKNGLSRQGLFRPDKEKALKKYLGEKRREYHLDLVEYLSQDRKRTVTAASNTSSGLTPALPPEVFELAETQKRPRSWVNVAEDGDLIRVIWPVFDEKGGQAGFLLVGNRSDMAIKTKMKAVETGLEGYRRLKRVRDPIRVNHYVALTIVALLSIFVSTWIAFHLAKSITGPIMELAKATNRIASGDDNVSIEIVAREDEIGTLVTSFNHMTRDLKAGKEELTHKNQALLESNAMLEQRRRYIEIILKSVAAGVISLDGQGVITTVNNSAEDILHIKADQVLGRKIDQVVTKDQRALLELLFRSVEVSPKGTAEKQVKLNLAGEAVSLRFHLTQLKDESGNDLGMVIVFDDLSEVEKVQRMTAWREVARRMAHEIKNPLTPIQLSAQRLRKRYSESLGEDGRLFEECTQMIIRKVEELKHLVGEFSNFARLPEIRPTPNNLAEIVEETLVLYDGRHPNVQINFSKDPALPVFNLDRDQMARVVVNLLDNAVAAVAAEGEPGQIDIRINVNRVLKMVFLEVADNGVGIPPLAKRRLFEPYFSTKKSGTGLGLAIVSTIVADHDGFVRVQDNHPRGARFIVELPIRT